MMKKRLKYASALLLFTLAFATNAKTICAQEDYSYLVSNVPYVREMVKLGEEGLTWEPGIYVEDGVVDKVTYEIEIADNADFANPQKFDATEPELTLSKKIFGQQGGRYYARVRNCVTTVDGQQLYSDWSEAMEFVCVAITKRNFPGLYKILKNGSRKSTLTGTEKVVYDKNGDAWLDPEEIQGIYSLDTADVYKKKNGKYTVTKAPTISNLKGIEYLSQVCSISFARYGGKKFDVSKNKVDFINIRAVTAKKITVIAPQAENVSIQSDEGVKVSSMDVSQCGNAVNLLVYGNEGTKKLKLPQNKTKLKILSLSEFGFRNLNMNAYKNLRQLYVYDSKIRTVQVNKCKKLNYIYFYFGWKINRLNLASNRNLVGADFVKTPGLTRNTVKRPKGAKVTWGKGKWWYSTKRYKKFMAKLYQ